MQNLGLKHLSAGELLRTERKREGSPYGQIIETHIRNGSIVPVEITCKLLENVSYFGKRLPSNDNCRLICLTLFFLNYSLPLFVTSNFQ